MVRNPSPFPRRHVARAVLEGIACQSKDVVDSMLLDSALDLARLRVDGGVSLSDELLQIQADLCGADVQRPSDVETTAAGAAVAAGIGAGVFDGVDSLRAADTNDTTFEPKITQAQRDAKWASWQAAVQCTFGWADRA